MTSFPNLAFTTPGLNYDDFIYLSREMSPTIYNEFNRNIPAPSYLKIERNVFKNQVSSEDYQMILKKQQSAIDYFNDQIDKINKQIQTELETAGINVIPVTSHYNSEVPYKCIGIDGANEFIRAWRYFIVRGNFTKELAQRIYDDSIGRKDIRTNGYAGNADPNDFDKIDCYHIDSQQGLNRFIELHSACFAEREVRSTHAN